MKRYYRCSAVAGIVGFALGVASCTPAADAGALSEGDGANALAQAGAIERLVERTPSNVPSTGSAPRFVVDPGWPKPLPNNWRIGQVGGLFVDQHDNTWVYHRPRSLGASETRGMPAMTENAQGVPITGLGHTRPYSERIADCCVPAPSVLQFDKAGNLLQAWGGPADPGFVETRCRESEGCFWPAREHGIFVDHNDYVYISGNGQANQVGLGQFPWAATAGNDSHVLKFTSDGTFVYQIGHMGMDGPNSDDIDGGPNGTPQPFLPADMTVDPNTNRLYIADGYGNRRILIVDAATGQYIGHFGAYGQNPVTDAETSGDPYDSGGWMDDLNRGELRPRYFRSPLHCAKLSVDGLLYACDRGNNRVQIFNTDEVGQPCSNPNAEVGVCGFVRDVHVAPQAATGTASAVNFSTDPGETCLYVADLGNNTIWTVNRENLNELDHFGQGGRQIGEFQWLHSVTIDSEGNLYTGEVDTGSRVQKFIRYGPDTCSGTGRVNVGESR